MADADEERCNQCGEAGQELGEEAAAETADHWAANDGSQPIDALRDMATLTAEIICRAVFGPRLGREHATTIVASFPEYQRLKSAAVGPAMAEFDRELRARLGETAVG